MVEQRRDRGSACPRSICRARFSLRIDARSVRRGSNTSWLCLVPVGRSGLASLLLRALGPNAPIRVDVGGCWSLGLADTPLRPMGILVRRLVLDPRTQLGTCLGLLGVRAGLRELVSAWMEQSSGPVVRLQLRLRPVASLDSGATRAFRRRVRQRTLCRRVRIQYLHAHRVRASLHGARIHGIRGPEIVSADCRPGHSERTRLTFDRLHEPHAKRVSRWHGGEPRDGRSISKHRRGCTPGVIGLDAIRSHPRYDDRSKSVIERSEIACV